MFSYIFLLTLTSVVCMVTSQPVEIDIEMKGVHTSSRVDVTGGAGGEEPEEDIAVSSLHKLTVSDLTRMIAGMEAGLKYNYQGQIAEPGQQTYTLAQLRLQLAQTMDTVVTGGSSGTQSAPVVDGASVARFTLDDVRAMIAGMENGILYNHQGKVATPGQATLTMEQLQRFLNELSAQGSLTTADFTQADLDRMVLGMRNGLAYNYQGQIAKPGEQTLTLDQINEMLAQLAAKGMGSSAGTITGLTDQSADKTMKTASFTMDDIIRMKNGMERGLKFNFQGLEAASGELSLTLEQLNQLEANLKSMGGSIGTMTSQTGGSMGGLMQTASFTMDDIIRMKNGMQQGLRYNYQGQEAPPGEMSLTLEQLNQLESDLKSMGSSSGPMTGQTGGSVGGSMRTASFTMNDIIRMKNGMERGARFNYQGLEAAPGEITLTLEQLNQFEANLRNKGMGSSSGPMIGQTGGSMGGSMRTASFTMDDIIRMKNGMERGARFNYQGLEAAPGEITLTLEQLNQFEANLRSKGMGSSSGPMTGQTGGSMGGSIRTASFTMDDIIRMKNGMERGARFNYQGLEAAPGEITLTLEQLNQFEADLRNKGMGSSSGPMTGQTGGSMGGFIRTASFTMDDITRMKNGMEGGARFNYQGLEAAPGEITLTLEQLIQFEADLRNKGMGSSSGPMTGQTGGSMGGSIRTASFTMDDITRMKNGMERGARFNYQGREAAPGEITLTLEQLNQFEAYLRNKGMGSSAGTMTGHTGGSMGGTIRTASFTMDDIIRMKNGMDRGVRFNYQGLEAAPGEITLALEQLNQFEADLRSKGTGGSISTADFGTGKSSTNFTIEDIQKMISGMKKGETISNASLPSVVGHPSLNERELKTLLDQLEATSGNTGESIVDLNPSIADTSSALTVDSKTTTDIESTSNVTRSSSTVKSGDTSSALLIDSKTTTEIESTSNVTKSSSVKEAIVATNDNAGQTGAAVGATVTIPGSTVHAEDNSSALAVDSKTTTEIESMSNVTRSSSTVKDAITKVATNESTGQTGAVVGGTVTVPGSAVQAGDTSSALTVDSKTTTEIESMSNVTRSSSTVNITKVATNESTGQTGAAIGGTVAIPESTVRAGDSSSALTVDSKTTTEIDSTSNVTGSSSTGKEAIVATNDSTVQVGATTTSGVIHTPSLTIPGLSSETGTVNIFIGGGPGPLTIPPGVTTEIESTSNVTRSSSAVNITKVATNESTGQPGVAVGGTVIIPGSTVQAGDTSSALTVDSKTTTEIESTSNVTKSSSAVNITKVATNESTGQPGAAIGGTVTVPGSTKQAGDTSSALTVDSKTTTEIESMSNVTKSSSTVKEAIVATNESTGQTGAAVGGTVTVPESTVQAGDTSSALIVDSKTTTEIESNVTRSSSAVNITTVATNETTGHTGATVEGTVIIPGSTVRAGDTSSALTVDSKTTTEIESNVTRSSATVNITKVATNETAGQTGTAVGGTVTIPGSTVHAGDTSSALTVDSDTTKEIESASNVTKSSSTVNITKVATNETTGQTGATVGGTVTVPGSTVQAGDTSSALTVDSKTTTEIESASNVTRSSATVKEAIVATNDSTVQVGATTTSGVIHTPSLTIPGLSSETGTVNIFIGGGPGPLTIRPGVTTGISSINKTEDKKFLKEAKFSILDVMNILHGMDEGKTYNYKGEIASRGELKLPRKLLINYLFQLNTTVVQQAMKLITTVTKFTREHVEKMLKDTEKGQRYNYDGELAGPDDEETFTTDTLKLILDYLIDIALPNVARFKKAEISSTYEPGWSADKAVDDNTNQDMNLDSCFHTGHDQDPYFILDLGDVYDIKRLTLYNRQDCCDNRLRNVAISTGLTRNELEEKNFIPGPFPSITTVPFTAPTQAQFIKIQVKEPHRTFMHLCEVQVFGLFARKDACKGEPCKNGGTCTNTGGADNCVCTKGWGGVDCTSSDLCVVNPCLNGGSCINIPGADLCRCPPEWSGAYCQINKRNIALGKPARMSSLYQNNDKYRAEKGVDGGPSTDMNSGSCFHTNNEVQPSWTVDLGAVYDIQEIKLTNRMDCCTERATDIEILAGLTSSDMRPISFLPGELGANKAIPIPTRTEGQYVTVRIKNPMAQTLHLCEVEVFGAQIRPDACTGEPCKNGGTCTNTGGANNCVCASGWRGPNCAAADLCAIEPCLNGGTCTNIPNAELCSCLPGWTGAHCQISTRNIAFGKSAQMSSLYQNNDTYRAERGVDGNINTNMSSGACFHTNNEVQPSWTVDLGAVYEIQEIKLTNRKDCCSERARDIEILAGLTRADMRPIYFHAGDLGAHRTIPIMSGTEGQHVTVRIRNPNAQTLHLCEVEVFGIYVRPDRCIGVSCLNGGTCTNKGGVNNCQCPAGFGGLRCQLDESKLTEPHVNETSGLVEPDWMKSRVDPSACRRSNCNLPICYIPYANDCKSYIVCQRTAIGTYVAWRMRCAFGSYWGRGTTYTCEHVEELAKQGYKCPNDPCADRTVRTYPDEEEKNCRTYWTCENGVSYPACCPHGEQFDRVTLKCEKDRHEVCRSPCPLKVAGCSGGAHKQPFYDGNCRTYWDCDKGSPHPVCCPDGMSFDFFKGHCIHDSTCTDHCPLPYTQQVCGKITGSSTVQSYPLADGNCRTYMKCTAEGYDEPHCCRQDFFYDTVSGTCQRVEDMDSKCHTESCPAGYHEECRFSAVENPTQFYDNDADLVRDCAPGTTFAPKICTCDGTSTVDICKPEVWVKFDKLEDPWGIKNYGDGSISKFGDLTKNKTDLGITYGTFDGSSGLEVWRYDHTALPEVTMEITFQAVAANGQEKQILASNCMSVENGQPSFEVSLNPQTSKVVFTGKSKFDSAEVSVPYNKHNWNTYKLFFDGTNIVAMVEDPAGIAKREIQTAKLRGPIIAGVGPFKFGPCYNGFSSPMSNGLTGFMSNVMFSKCIDRRGRELLQEYTPPEIRTHTVPAAN